MGIHCRYPANYKGYYIQSTMSPLVTSLMLLMVMVINTKGAPNPDTDNYSYSYEEDPVPCYPNCPPSKGQRFKRSAAPNPDTIITSMCMRILSPVRQTVQTGKDSKDITLMIWIWI